MAQSTDPTTADRERAERAELAAAAAELAAHARWAQDAGLAGPPSPAAGSRAAAPRAAPPLPAAAPPAPRPAERPASAALFGPRPAPAAVAPPAAASRPLEVVRAELGDCTRCKLCKGRTNIVFGVGDPRARIVFVGEAPGEDEDVKGEPFVGKAGQLLTKMIEAMGLARSDVYICNTVKCRPPNNRNPEPDELAACEPFLVAQLASVKAEVIVTLGKFASQALLRDAAPISRLRGVWREYQGVPLMPTFHPAYLLRSPSEKGKVWQDLQQVMKRLGMPVRGGGA